MENSRLQLFERIARLHSLYVAEENPRAFFDTVLNEMLAITKSEYGFIGEVLRTDDGTPYLKTYALTNISWNDETRAFYEEHAPQGLEFHNLETLFGRVMTSGELVVSNGPETDPRAGGIPTGHPPLRAFLGVPLKYHGTLIGVAGLANRSGGYSRAFVDEMTPLWRAAEALVRINQINRARERAEAQTEEKSRALERASRLETAGMLAAGVAHDMNNLLLAIMGNSDLMRLDVPDGSDLAESLDEIDFACRRAVGLMRQLNTFTGSSVRVDETLEFREVIEQVERLLERLMGGQVRLAYELTTQPTAIIGDVNRLSQVILNLVSNARDALVSANIPAPVITVKLANAMGTDGRPGRLLSVCDNGPGIPTEVRAKVFEPFYTTKARGKGSGLGLYMVHDIVKDHGGTIGISSEFESGTRFDVWLPEAPADASLTTKISDEHLRGTELVWLVDDEAPVRHVLSRTIEAAGYRCRSFGHPREAIARWKNVEEKPDLIVTDIILQGMRGYDMVKEMLGPEERVNVLYISGYPGDDFGGDVPLAVHSDFLEKPFTTERLLLQLRQTLSRGQ